MKKGISLIVLVITIIVMIILTASIVVSLNNTGAIDKANKAVDLTNEQEVYDLAALIWAETYMEEKRGSDLESIVKEKLKNKGVTEDEWKITVTNVGISIVSKNSEVGLGSLITEDNYGDTVDYSVTVNGIIHNKWRILYHNNEYVYLIATNSIGTISLNGWVTPDTLKNTTVETLPEGSNTLLDLYNIFRVGATEDFKLQYSANYYAVAELVSKYTNFANTNDYGKYVVGAIGGPTIELLAAGREAKKYTPSLMPLTMGGNGYLMNGKMNLTVANDELYVPSTYSYWLASPSDAAMTANMIAGNKSVAFTFFDATSGVRPVICLKSSIPAKVGNGDYNFTLIK